MCALPCLIFFLPVLKHDHARTGPHILKCKFKRQNMHRDTGKLWLTSFAISFLLYLHRWFCIRGDEMDSGLSVGREGVCWGRGGGGGGAGVLHFCHQIKLLQSLIFLRSPPLSNSPEQCPVNALSVWQALQIYISFYHTSSSIECPQSSVPSIVRLIIRMYTLLYTDHFGKTWTSRCMCILCSYSHTQEIYKHTHIHRNAPIKMKIVKFVW